MKKDDLGTGRERIKGLSEKPDFSEKGKLAKGVEGEDARRLREARERIEKEKEELIKRGQRPPTLRTVGKAEPNNILSRINSIPEQSPTEKPAEQMSQQDREQKVDALFKRIRGSGDGDLGKLPLLKLKLLRSEVENSFWSEMDATQASNLTDILEEIDALIAQKEAQENPPSAPEEKEMPQVIAEKKAPIENVEKIKISFEEASLPKIHPTTNEEATINQDTYFSIPENKSFAVLDGVGGGVSGDLASKLSRDHIRDSIKEIKKDATTEERISRITQAIQGADELIKKRIAASPELSGMATTVSLVHIYEDKESRPQAIIANVGDSRVYVERDNGELEQVTVDDSQINFMLGLRGEGEEVKREIKQKFNNLTEKEQLTKDEQALFDVRNVILKAVGQLDSPPTIQTIGLQGVKRIIIVSDGVSDVLTDEKIVKAKTAKELVETAREENKKGGIRQKTSGDDMTAIVVNITPEIPKPETAKQPAEVVTESPTDLQKQKKEARRQKLREVLVRAQQELEQIRKELAEIRAEKLRKAKEQGK